jgi:esterase/lipase
MEKRDNMTLEEFLRRADGDVQAFAASTRSAQAEGTDGFTGPFLHRTREDWWREVAAYYEYTELAERIASCVK